MQPPKQVIFELNHCCQSYKHVGHHRGEDEDMFLQCADNVVCTIVSILSEIAFDCDDVAFHVNNRIIKFSELSVLGKQKRVKGLNTRRIHSLCGDPVDESKDGTRQFQHRIHKYRINRGIGDDVQEGNSGLPPAVDALPPLLEPRRPDGPRRRPPIFAQVSQGDMGPAAIAPGRLGMFEVTAFDIDGALSHVLYSKRRRHKFPELDFHVLLSALLSFLMAVAEQRGHEDLSRRISQLAVDLGDLQLKALRPLKRPMSARGKRPSSAQSDRLAITTVTADVPTSEVEEMEIARGRPETEKPQSEIDVLRQQLASAVQLSEQLKTENGEVRDRLAKSESALEDSRAKHALQLRTAEEKAEQTLSECNSAQHRLTEAEAMFVESSENDAAKLHLVERRIKELELQHADTERRLIVMADEKTAQLELQCDDLQKRLASMVHARAGDRETHALQQLFSDALEAQVIWLEGQQNLLEQQMLSSERTSAEEASSMQMKVAQLRSALCDSKLQCEAIQQQLCYSEASQLNAEARFEQLELQTKSAAQNSVSQVVGMLQRLSNSAIGPEDISKAIDVVSSLDQILEESLDMASRKLPPLDREMCRHAVLPFQRYYSENFRGGKIVEDVAQELFKTIHEVAVELKFDIDFAHVRRDRMSFQKAVQRDLRDGLGLVEADIAIRDIRPGSVIVDLSIRDVTKNTCTALHDLCAGKLPRSSFVALTEALGQPVQVISYAIQSVHPEEPFSRRWVFISDCHQSRSGNVVESSAAAEEAAARSQYFLNQIKIPHVPEVPAVLASAGLTGNIAMSTRAQKAGVFSASSSVCTGDSSCTELIEQTASEVLCRIVADAETEPAPIFHEFDTVTQASDAYMGGEIISGFLQHIDAIVSVEKESQIQVEEDVVEDEEIANLAQGLAREACGILQLTQDEEVANFLARGVAEEAMASLVISEQPQGSFVDFVEMQPVSDYAYESTLGTSSAHMQMRLQPNQEVENLGVLGDVSCAVIPMTSVGKLCKREDIIADDLLVTTTRQAAALGRVEESDERSGICKCSVGEKALAGLATADTVLNIGAASVPIKMQVTRCVAHDVAEDDKQTLVSDIDTSDALDRLLVEEVSSMIGIALGDGSRQAEVGEVALSDDRPLSLVGTVSMASGIFQEADAAV